MAPQVSPSPQKPPRSLASTLARWPWLETLRTLRLRLRDDQLALTAGSLTFTTLIALVPLLSVGLALFTAFPMFGQSQQALEQFFLRSLVPDSIARPVLTALTQFAGKAKGVGFVGVVFLLVTAVALMLTVDRTLNRIWRVNTTRSLAHRVLVYWAALTLGPLALGLSLWSIAMAVGGVKVLAGMSLLLSTAQVAVIAAAAAALFHFVPATQVRWGHAWAGGVFVALAFELAKRALTAYLEWVPAYSTIYGAFAAAPILLLWVYLGWLIVLMGAVIAAYAPALQAGLVRRPEHTGLRFDLCVQLLSELEAARHSNAKGRSGTQLARALRTDPLQLAPLQDCLRRLGWIGKLDESGTAGEARWVMLIEPSVTAALPLLDAMLLPPAARSAWRHKLALDKLTVADLIP
jgi:membrane protein